jgi:putative DNA primase/helicase
VPLLANWQAAATTDPAALRRWWARQPRCNVGVQLGPRSGLVDVECDSPEAERALTALLGDDYPVVPTFSARRGKHRLFAWSPGLPHPDRAVFHFRGVEFRTGNGGKGAQSLLPPSIHPSGLAYAWLVSPDEADPVPLPAAALDVIRRGLDRPPSGGKAGGRRAPALAEGQTISEGARNDVLFRAGCRLRHFGHSEGEIRALLLVMNAERCRPPLAEAEVEAVARSAAGYPSGAGGAVPFAPQPPRRRHRPVLVCRRTEVG